MFVRVKKVVNGDSFTPVNEYLCNKCLGIICESHPHFSDSDTNFHLCSTCAFIEGKFTDKEFLRTSGFYGFYNKAAVHMGGIYLWNGDKNPWDYPNSYYRKTKQYKDWRKKVFERDGYSCRHCKSNSELQAHHIKPFSKFIKLRYTTSNGLTLCKTCHKEEHKRLKSGDTDVWRISN